MENNTPYIKKECWGKIGDKEIYLFTITNAAGNSLSVLNYGAAAVSLMVPDKTGNRKDVLLGYDTLEKYINDTVYLGTVVGRCANRIAGPKVIIEGEEYFLPLREGGYHAHGGVEGFNKKVFDYTLIHTSEKTGVAFNYKSPHLEEGYPGNLNFTVTHYFGDSNRWTIEYNATTDRPTIINPTQHAYFNLSGKLNSSILNHYLQINTAYYLPVNSLVLPTGVFASVNNTPFDFLTCTKIGTRIHENHEQLKLGSGYDHGWALKSSSSAETKHAAIAYDEKSGIRLDLYTTEPDLHFYSGNWLSDSIIGKGNKIYNKQTGFCFETQHFPDAPNKPHFPSIVLKPGEIFYSKTIYQLSNLH